MVSEIGNRDKYKYVILNGHQWTFDHYKVNFRDFLWGAFGENKQEEIWLNHGHPNTSKELDVA